MEVDGSGGEGFGDENGGFGPGESLPEKSVARMSGSDIRVFHLGVSSGYLPQLAQTRPPARYLPAAIRIVHPRC